jgi:hypothetical protein
MIVIPVIPYSQLCIKKTKQIKLTPIEGYLLQIRAYNGKNMGPEGSGRRNARDYDSSGSKTQNYSNHSKKGLSLKAA